jgi:hypothetical protein
MRYKIPLKGLYLSGVLTPAFIPQHNEEGCPNTLLEPNVIKFTNNKYYLLSSRYMFTDVSGDHPASMFRVEEYNKQITSKKEAAIRVNRV